MATNRREIELLISARDTTGRTFQQVASSIKDISRNIDEQVAAASRGEASLQDLRKSQEALAQAGRDLSNIQGQVDAFRRLSDTVSRNKDAFSQAEANLAKYKTELASLEKVTAAQERKLDGLERKVQTTGQAFRKSETDATAMSASLQKVGVDTAKLESAQAQIVSSARQVGASFTAINSSVDTFGDNLRLAQAAEQQLAQQTGLTRKIAEAQQLGDASRLVRLYAQAVDEVHLADQRLAALNGFRQVGAQAAEASRDVSRFAGDASRLATSSSEVAAGLRAIINPGQEAIRTLDGVEKAVKDAGDAIGTEGQSVAAYQVALNRVSEAGAALVRQGALVDTFQQQEAAVASARAELDRAQVNYEKAARAMQQADAASENLVRDLRVQEAAFETAGRAVQNEETRLLELQRQLEAAGIDTNNLAAAQLRLAAAARQAAAAQGAGNKILGTGGEKTGAFLGLRPHELQNLSFQIQDIFVSLASGQAPLTVLVQQGTQIGALFPGLIANLGRFALAWGPVLIVLAAVGVAFGLVIDKINDLKAAQAALDLRNITNIDASAVEKATEKFEDLGASAEEARKSVGDLLDTASSKEQFTELTAAAEELNKKLGIEVPEAVKLLNDAMTGGIEQAEALALSTRALSEEELEHADALFQAGKAAEARQYILDRVNMRLKDMSSLTDGVFTPAVKNLKAAWESFTGFLGRVFAPVIDDIDRRIKNVIIGFTFLTGLLAGKGFDEARAEAVLAVRVPKAGEGQPRQPRRVSGLAEAMAIDESRGQKGVTPQQIRDRQFQRELDKQIDSTRTLTREERLLRAETDARREATEKGVSAYLVERAATQAVLAERKKIREEDARGAKSDDAARRKAAAAAARLQRQQDTAVNQLKSQLRQLNADIAKGSSADLANRLQVINDKYEKIATTIDKLRGLGVGTVDGKTLAQLEAQAAAQQDRVEQEETIKFYNEQINALVDQRESQLETISAAQERGGFSAAEAFKAADELNKRISPKIVEAAQTALEVAYNLAKINPSPELMAMIAKLETLKINEPVNNQAGQILQNALANESAKLDQILSDRDTLVDAYQKLGELGIKTPQELRDAAVVAFADTATAAKPVLDSLTAIVEQLHATTDPLTGLPLLTDTAYQAWLAKIQAVNAGLQQTNTYLSTLERDTMNQVAQAGVNAFSTLAEGIAGFIRGTKSLGDVFKSVGRSILQSLAQITLAIGQAIIKFLILRALESAAGLPPGTLSGGGGGAPKLFGLFHSGGVVGSKGGSGVRRTSTGGGDPWIAAPRFHNGGGAGLRPDEYRAVLKRREEVLTEDDPRHVNNLGGGGSSAPPQSLKQVLLLDPDAVPSAMRSRAGQQSILTVIRQNKETIKQALG